MKVLDQVRMGHPPQTKRLGGSGMGFSVWCYLANSFVKCLEGSSNIFGNGRTSLLVFENLRQSSGMFGSPREI